MLTRNRLAVALLAAGFLTLLNVESAEAQFSGQSARSLGFATRNYLYNRPTVSPYLNLTYRNASYGLSNYFTQVRPRVEQQQQQAARQRAAVQNQAQMNQVQAQFRQSQQQQAGMMTTGQMGWSQRGYPRRGIYLSYYPGMNQIRGRR